MDGVLDRHTAVISEAYMLPKPYVVNRKHLPLLYFLVILFCTMSEKLTFSHPRHSSCCFYRDDPIADAETEAWAFWFGHFLPPEDNPKEPVSDLYYPVVDELSEVNNGADPSKNKLVGMLASSLYWRTLIRDILPSSSKGLVIVFENPCNEAFTYQVR